MGVAHFFWMVIRWSFIILLITVLFSLFAFFPYVMDIKAMSHVIAMEVMNNGYLDEDLRKKYLLQLSENNSFTGKSTLLPHELEPGESYIPGVPGPPNVSIEACYVTESGACLALEPITYAEAQQRIQQAYSSGIAPYDVLDRDIPIRVTIKTNYKIQVMAFGKPLVAYLPMVIQSSGITVRDYRW